VQEVSVHAVEPGDRVEDIPPHIEIIPLVNDAVVLTDGQFGAAKNGRDRVLFKAHFHFPLEEHHIGFHHDGLDFHVQLFTTFGQPVAHAGEFFDALDALDAVFKNDILVVIRKNMRPVRLAVWVVGFRPQRTDPIDGEWFENCTGYEVFGWN